MRARLVATIETRDALGEGVLWRDSDQSAWWTDIIGRRLHRLRWPSRELQTWTTPERLCAFGFIEGDEDWLVAAFAPGFALFRPRDGSVRWLAQPDSLGPGTRLNDGRVDAFGRFWAGSMGEPPFEGPPRGVLYCLDAREGVTEWARSVGISNGLCWSPDGRRMHFADSMTATISIADVDGDGRPGSFTPWVRIEAGAPDGGVTDASGRYWCAVWEGARVDVFDTAGQAVGMVPVPAPQPTCPAFGGADHSLLFVTSARDGLDADTLANHPASGSLFVFETDARGLPARRADAAFLSA